jgi:hypothetical protein
VKTTSLRQTRWCVYIFVVGCLDADSLSVTGAITLRGGLWRCIKLDVVPS